MPLLVVPLARDESESLALSEWDALCARAEVVFEHQGHPLMDRLQETGVAVARLMDELDAGDDSRAFVAEPSSERIVELARAGAIVSSGTASSPDDLTAARGAPIVRRASSALGGLAVVMARLRSKDGCPWDIEQTHESLQVHLIEEAHEVLEAIDRGLVGDELEEELGDLLLQVVFHAQMAADDGRFDVAGVAERLVAKLVHRHPHVFADTSVTGAGEVIRNWEALKESEKDRVGPFDDIPEGLPALLAAYKTQKRAAGLGFEADEGEARARVAAAVDDPDGAEALGTALFWLVAVARARGIDPEGALRRATARFRDSF